MGRHLRILRFCCVGHESMELKIGMEVVWVMFGYRKSIYAVSYGRIVAWLFCWRTRNRTLLQAISIACATTFTALLLFYAMVFRA
jgi:hypothetical protein